MTFILPGLPQRGPSTFFRYPRLAKRNKLPRHRPSSNSNLLMSGALSVELGLKLKVDKFRGLYNWALLCPRFIVGKSKPDFLPRLTSPLKPNQSSLNNYVGSTLQS